MAMWFGADRLGPRRATRFPPSYCRNPARSVEPGRPLTFLMALEATRYSIAPWEIRQERALAGRRKGGGRPPRVRSNEPVHGLWSLTFGTGTHATLMLWALA